MKKPQCTYFDINPIQSIDGNEIDLTKVVNVGEIEQELFDESQQTYIVFTLGSHQFEINNSNFNRTEFIELWKQSKI